jgi:hypothetical protein
MYRKTTTQTRWASTRPAVEKQMGIIGMKVMARGRILSSWTPPPVEQQKRSWEGRGAIATTPGTLTKRETFNYNLSLPISTCASPN